MSHLRKALVMQDFKSITHRFTYVNIYEIAYLLNPLYCKCMLHTQSN